MTLEKQIKHINNSLFVAKMENIIQFMYEDELKTSVAEIFHSMRTEILANLEAYYGDVLFNAHMDLILAPIHEHHKQYYETIVKYKLKEHRKGRVQGKRLITRAKKYAKQYSKAYYSGAVKADTINIPMGSIIEKDKLFATSDYSAEQMRDKTFVASENTLARVDKDINGIITDGYRDGWGINDVANKIETRFNQLETWEARRIARTEIHGSHMQGVMNSYEDMGVEYLQWGAAHDNRTRDTHAALDGEIIPWDGVFSNGLRYPGDTNGPISEWINCRCGVLPWFCPPGMMVPVGMTNFRESDLIPTHAFQTNEDRIKEYLTSEGTEKPSAIPGMNKYSLTSEEKVRLKELLIKKEAEELGLIGKIDLKQLKAKEEFNILHNKKLTSKLTSTEKTRYDELVGKYGKTWGVEIPKTSTNEVFENPNYFKLSSAEKARYDELMQKTKDKTITRAERTERSMLGERSRIQNLHEKLLTEGLDETETIQYLDAYDRLKFKGLNLPELSSELRFTTPQPVWERYSYYDYKIGNKFALNSKEAEELYKLEKKELLSQYKDIFSSKLTSVEKARLKELNAQREFNHYYYVRKNEGGLNYQAEMKFKELFHQFKSKLNLTEDILEISLPKYNLKIKPEEITKDTKLVKLRGVTEDGHLPGNYEVDDLFTIDITKCTQREQDVVQRWLGNDYAMFRDVIGRCDGDLEKYTEYVLTLPKDKMHKYYPNIEHWLIDQGNLTKAKSVIVDMFNDITHDYKVLENILENNQLKEAMTLWRTEERLHIDGKLEVGKIVTFPGNNSTAVTKEGAEHFAEVSHREFEWMYEIEAPAGTKGAYVAELNQNPKFAEEMEFLLAKDTKMEIVSFDEINHYVKFRIIP